MSAFPKVPAGESGGKFSMLQLPRGNSRVFIGPAHPAMFYGDRKDRNRRIVEIIVHLQAILSPLGAATTMDENRYAYSWRVDLSRRGAYLCTLSFIAWTTSVYHHGSFTGMSLCYCGIACRTTRECDYFDVEESMRWK